MARPVVRPVVSLGGSFVLCPHCNGDGLSATGTLGCEICTPERDFWAGVRGPGWLELPLAPGIAEHVYNCGSAAAMQLVHDASEEGETAWYGTKEVGRVAA